MTANPISMTKDIIRRKMRKARENLPPSDFQARGVAAQRMLVGSPQWQNARSVGLYMALAAEAPTDILLQNALAVGKDVWLPKILDAALGKMEFWPCQSPEKLAPGPFGIMEPVEKENGGGCPELVVVPGLAFDLHGCRLGYGGGYYDRWLYASACQAILVCGLAFAFQVVHSLPHEPWDMRTNGICTEEFLIWL